MLMDKQKILQNATSNRILEVLCRNGEQTTIEIQKHLSDIPQSTLYRYMKYLEQFQIISVTNEEKIRGQVEKSYAISDTFFINWFSLYLADDEYQQMKMELEKIFRFYGGSEKAKNRKLRKVFIMSATEEDENGKNG